MRRLVLLLALLALGVPARAAAADVPPPRLDTLTAQLRDSPLAIDDDVVYLLSDAERREVVRALKAAPVPFHVALLPALDEDESGGDQARQVRGLYDRLKQDGVYVVVDERGGMEVADVQIPFKVSLDFGLIYGGSSLDEDEEPGANTVADRLAQLVDVVAQSPAGPPGPFDGISRPEAELPEIEVRRGDEFAVMAIVFGIGGILAGALLWGLTVLVAAILRGARA